MDDDASRFLHARGSPGGHSRRTSCDVVIVSIGGWASPQPVVIDDSAGTVLLWPLRDPLRQLELVAERVRPDMVA
jgi:hypothetical protein